MVKGREVNLESILSLVFTVYFQPFSDTTKLGELVKSNREPSWTGTIQDPVLENQEKKNIQTQEENVQNILREQASNKGPVICCKERTLTHMFTKNLIKIRDVTMLRQSVQKSRQKSDKLKKRQ